MDIGANIRSTGLPATRREASEAAQSSPADKSREERRTEEADDSRDRGLGGSRALEGGAAATVSISDKAVERTQAVNLSVAVAASLGVSSADASRAVAQLQAVESTAATENGLVEVKDSREKNRGGSAVEISFGPEARRLIDEIVNQKTSEGVAQGARNELESTGSAEADRQVEAAGIPVGHGPANPGETFDELGVTFDAGRPN